MRRCRKTLYAAVLGLSLGMTIAWSGQEQTLLPQAEAQGKKWKYFGASTCGRGACHAASKPGKKRPANEHTTWAKNDRHSRAFETLFNEDSEDMCEKLEIEDASKDQRCTVCHSTAVKKELQGDKYNAEDGVSCDGCHGPAEGWFKPHVKPHDYKDMLKLGMFDTRNMWRRADMCVLCHLQIEPELVEAGHPDLSFELYAHSNREPIHWLERMEWAAIRGWSVGQAVSLREALVKIERRLKLKKSQDAIDNAVYLAQAYIAVFKHGVAIFGGAQDKAVIKELEIELNKESIDKEKLVKLCGRAHPLMNKLGKTLNRWDKFTGQKVRMLYKRIANDKALKEADEFVAEQAAGALFALYNADKQGQTAPLGKAVQIPEVLKKLLVRPTVGLPEELFDEEGEFKTELWLERLEKAKALIK
jgi:hypothetical protein